MANEEHLKILKQGVKEWNAWRAQNREIIPDLSGAYLPRANFPDLDLNDANLIGSYLCDADLIEADLRNANLRSTDLRNANLRSTDLRNANLRSADLRETDIRSVDLRNADLKDAILHYTFFGDTNLQSAWNLDSCQHIGPSIIDQMTLVKSGRLPEVFLKGCGLSDDFIQQIPFLFWDKAAFEFYSCFISYSAKDEDFAKRLYADLQSNGVRCWFAPEDMKIGDRIRPTIDESIRIYDKLLLILSPNSINSPWVEKEVETAFEKESRDKHTVLFPIRLDDGVMQTATAWAADIRRTRHIGDFSRWKNHDAYRKAFERLMRDLREA